MYELYLACLLSGCLLVHHLEQGQVWLWMILKDPSGSNHLQSCLWLRTGKEESHGSFMGQPGTEMAMDPGQLWEWRAGPLHF